MLPQSFSYCLQMFTTLLLLRGLKTKDAQKQRAQSKQLVFKYLIVELIKTRPRLTSLYSGKVDLGSGGKGKWSNWQ